jgi:hypothetical protein
MRRLIAILLVVLAACESRPKAPPEAPREAVWYFDVLETPHREMQSLPPWAACWFPHEAYSGALRRAQPCPPETRATRTYTRGELAGCWVIRSAEGRPFDGVEPYDGPVRLRLHPTAAMRREGFGQNDGAVVAAGRSPAPDQHGRLDFWLFAPPDSVQMYAAALFSGTRFDFRVRGDSMVGMVRGFYDAIHWRQDTASIAVGRVTAHRIGCP